MSEQYQGPATVRVGERGTGVEVRLAGRFEPVDGRYHWGGRVRPDPQVVDWVRDGQRAVSIQIAAREPVPARLGELDPWGGVRVIGVGPPPWLARFGEAA